MGAPAGVEVRGRDDPKLAQVTPRRRTLLLAASALLAISVQACHSDSQAPATRRPSSANTSPTTEQPLAPALEQPALGVYTAPVDAGGIDGLTRFGASAGSAATVALAYLDVRGSWANFESPDWLLDPWSQWLDGDPRRQLVLSVPLLLNRSAGQFGNAALDGHFVRLARAIRDHGIADRTIIRLGWEMTGTWNPYGRRYSPNGAAFRAMWDRVVPKMKAVHPFRFSWCVTLGGDLSPEAFFPSPDLVDIITFDRYDTWVPSSAITPEQRWDRLLIEPHGMNWILEFARAKQKPLAIDEWGLWNAHNSPSGSNGGGDNPTFVSNLLSWADQHDLLYTTYYDSPRGGPDTTLAQNPLALSALQQAIATQLTQEQTAALR